MLTRNTNSPTNNNINHAGRKKEQQEAPKFISTGLSLVNPSTSNHTIFSDFWENGNKLVVCFDIPGVEFEMMDIVIMRSSVLVSVKRALFECTYLQDKYSPVQLNRFTQKSLPFVHQFEIGLPFMVVPQQKKAFYHYGSVYLTLNKLEQEASSVVNTDWQNHPAF